VSNHSGIQPVAAVRLALAASLIAAILGGCAEGILMSAVMETLVSSPSMSMTDVRVESEPTGAQVDVNGISVGRTPAVVSLNCSKTWVGLAHSPDGWARGNAKYKITVYHLSGTPGNSLSKHIDACQWTGDQPAAIKFDLGLGTVTSTQTFE
jgi:hypothetical protein